MIILGIDPGIGRMGYALIEKQGQKLKVFDYGCLETPKADAHGDRLLSVRKKLIDIFSRNKPEVLGIEKLFFVKNVTTAFAVGEARGIVMLTAAENRARVMEFEPSQIKQSLTGYGNANKKQIQQMVKIIFKLKEIPQPDDAADALAIAYTAAVMAR